jgi:hypothetical protein
MHYVDVDTTKRVTLLLNLCKKICIDEMYNVVVRNCVIVFRRLLFCGIGER